MIELNNHMHAHKILNLYSCPECEYQDPSKDKIKVHMKSHDKENPDIVVCNVCKKKC